jgi:hypothetical protein
MTNETEQNYNFMITDAGKNYTPTANFVGQTYNYDGFDVTNATVYSFSLEKKHEYMALINPIKIQTYENWWFYKDKPKTDIYYTLSQPSFSVLNKEYNLTVTFLNDLNKAPYKIYSLDPGTYFNCVSEIGGYISIITVLGIFAACCNESGFNDSVRNLRRKKGLIVSEEDEKEDPSLAIDYEVLLDIIHEHKLRKLAEKPIDSGNATGDHTTPLLDKKVHDQ